MKNITDKLRIAVIGCGWAGEKHVLAFKKLSSRAEVVALVDTDNEFLKEKSKEWDISACYADYRDALSREDIDAVSICLPHNLHAQTAIESAKAGKHILCEKPMAVTLEEADAMIDATEENKVKLMIAESALFSASTRTLKEYLDAGYIGNPILLRKTFMPRHGSKTGYVYPGRRAWLSDKKIAGGGQWLVNGIHEVAVCRRLFGEVVSICATEHRTSDYQLNIEGTVCALLQFQGGQSGQLIVTPQISNYGIFGGTILHGDSGALAIRRGKDDVLEVYSGKLNTPNQRLDVPIQVGHHGELEHFVLEMEHFLDYVQKNTACICNGISERQSLAVILGGFESIETGKKVDIKQREKGI
ncbi:Gfo/Idh/MocA family oxidoreductase [bacterium]|nr:Gfo/Idh/MocA family oxidoreductase [bacterium]